MRRAYTRRSRQPLYRRNNNTTRTVRRAFSGLSAATSSPSTLYSQQVISDPNHLLKYWNGIQYGLNSEDEKIFQQTSNASTYGYLTVAGFQTLLSQYRLQDGREPVRVFYDLGSGLGMPNVIAATLVPTIQKSVGIELSSQRVREANQVLNAIRSDHPDISARVNFINGDILSTQWSYGDADIIWISSLCFSPEIGDKIAERLNTELRKGTHVLTSKAMPRLNHSKYNKFTAAMSWAATSEVNHYII
jgi:hypothetical protein